MRKYKSPDRFGLPPNYRWILGQPSDPHIPSGIPYTYSVDIVIVPIGSLTGARMCPDPKQNSKHKIKEDIKCQ